MMETAAPELHDAILLCVGVAAAYLVVTVLQLMQLKRRRPAAIVAREPSVGSQALLNADKSSQDALSFSEQLQRTSIEAGLKRLELEVARLHEELQVTQEEVQRLRSERSAQNVAPHYNEAINLAQRGLSAVGIASRCGLSIGEADLVAALARNPQRHSSAEDAPQQRPMESEYSRHQHDRYRAAA